MKTLVRTAAFGLTALLVVGARGAQAQITKTGNGYLFRVKYHKGEKLSYEMTSEATPPGAKAPVKTSIPMKMTVADVQNGIATVDIAVGPITVNGRPLAQQQTRQVKMNSRGRAVGGNVPGLENMATALPEKPLAVGQTFTSTATVNQMGQQIKVKSSATFKGIKSVDGKPVAVLAVASTGTGTMSVKSVGTALFSVADGSLVSMSANQQVAIHQGQNNISFKSTTHVRRL